MVERLVLLETEVIKYEGLFEAKEVIGVIKQWAKDKGYVYLEISHIETTKPEGKYVEINGMCFKKLTDYTKSLMRLRVQFNDYKDVVIDQDGKKKKMHEGKVAISTTGFIETDYEGRWESKPHFYFMRILWHKYVYSPLISGHETQIKEDVTMLRNNVKSFLNLTQFQ